MTLVTNKNTIADTKTLPLQEPDVVASAKTSCSRNTNLVDQQVASQQNVPVAPPRRKKKSLKSSGSSLSLVVCKMLLEY